MAEKKLKAAIIGTGMIANYAHIPACRAFPDRVSVEAVCNIHPETAHETAQRFSIPRVFTDPEEMLLEIQPDIVLICSPNASHKELSKLALEHGANVICEKPLAFNYADAVELFDLAKSSHRLLVACQTGRFNREFFAAREYIDSGLLGKMYFAEISRIRRRGIPAWGSFHKKSTNGGGAMADIGVYALDALLWMMGSPRVTAVSGTSSAFIAKNEKGILYNPVETGAAPGARINKIMDPAEFDVEEFASGTLRAEGGISINFKVAWAANLPGSSTYTILGDKAGITLPEMKIHTTLGKNQVDTEPRLFGLGEFDENRYSGHYYLIQNVLDVLLDRAELLIKPEETLNVTAAIDMFYRSCAAAREITLNDLKANSPV